MRNIGGMNRTEQLKAVILRENHGTDTRSYRRVLFEIGIEN